MSEPLVIRFDIRDDGTVMRTPLSEVRVINRNTQGVRIMRVDEGTRIAAVALVPHAEPEPEVDFADVPSPVGDAPAGDTPPAGNAPDNGGTEA